MPKRKTKLANKSNRVVKVRQPRKARGAGLPLDLLVKYGLPAVANLVEAPVKALGQKIAKLIHPSGSGAIVPIYSSGKGSGALVYAGQPRHKPKKKNLR